MIKTSRFSWTAGGTLVLLAACLGWTARAQTSRETASDPPSGVVGAMAPPSLASATPDLLLAQAAPARMATSPDEHASHHPGSQTGGGNGVDPMGGMPAMANASPASAGATGAMGGTMDDMMEGEHGAPRASPLYSRLITLPPLDNPGRHQLEEEAQSRIHQGLRLVDQASAAAARAASPRELQQANEQMREGLEIYESGSALRAALQDKGAPEAVALNWFRNQLNLPAAASHSEEDGVLLGLSPAHLLLMTILVLVSAGLLILQLLRLQRVRELVGSGGTGTARAAVPSAPAIGGGAVAPALPSPSPAPPAPSGAGPKGDLPRSNASAAGGTALRRPKPWSGELRVAGIFRETPTIETFRLVAPNADRLRFDFLPGQFLQVEVEPETGKPVRRSYTIASSPTQRGHVELTVKREEQGVVSRFLHDQVKVGDHIKVSGPFGSFTFTGSDADSIVLIAGGVGITPMMSVLRYLTDTAWPGEIFFVYGARSTEEFVFRLELEQLERRHERLHVLAAMHRSPGTVWLGPEGNITKEMLQAAVPDVARRRIHLCGPPPMMTAIKRLLTELGVPEAQIHSEAFGPVSLPAEHAPEAVTTDEAAASAPTPATTAVGTAPASSPRPEVAPTTVTFAVSGVSAALPANQSVLEAAEGAGVEIPYSCRIGECGVCTTRMVQGEVTMAVETGLDPADKAQGYILACQAKSTGVPVVVEA
jgi:ferredoxin-NADP reductase